MSLELGHSRERCRQPGSPPGTRQLWEQEDQDVQVVQPGISERKGSYRPVVWDRLARGSGVWVRSENQEAMKAWDRSYGSAIRTYSAAPGFTLPQGTAVQGACPSSPPCFPISQQPTMHSPSSVAQPDSSKKMSKFPVTCDHPSGITSHSPLIPGPHSSASCPHSLSPTAHSASQTNGQ